MLKVLTFPVKFSRKLYCSFDNSETETLIRTVSKACVIVCKSMVSYQKFVSDSFLSLEDTSKTKAKAVVEIRIQ